MKIMVFMRDENLFCPVCKESGDLWIYPTKFYEVACERCGCKWERDKLVRICTRLIKRAEEKRSSQHWAACLRIQMQHTTNPFTGKCLA